MSDDLSDDSFPYPPCGALLVAEFPAIIGTPQVRPSSWVNSGMIQIEALTGAATQFACGPEIAGNVDRAERVVRAAAARGAQIILLPELFETPYFCKDQN